MDTPAPGEKKSLVMIYAHNSFVRGELITRENVRVGIWLRTQGVPQYIHLRNAQVLLLNGSPAKALHYAELFFPTEQIIGFHLVPPAAEPLDYDPHEANRAMINIDLMVGTFIVKGKLRVSTQADLATAIEVAHSAWLSVYDADITNPYLPQMPAIQVPMLLVNPQNVSFGR